MNPIVNGFFADPEARYYNGKYYIYVTQSFTEYEKQMNIDVFSSSDLKSWEHHENIIDMSGYPYIHQAVWAPTVIEKGGKYYLIFASNDIQNDDEIGGLEIAVSDSPTGPFINHTGKSIVDRFIYGAQPIDAHLFKDDDGTIYLYYGGWQHCNVCIMNEEMNGFVPLDENGTIFKSITPDGYTEGPCMMKRSGVYHFMWSQGAWKDGTYRVCTSNSKNPLEITKASRTILQSSPIANGPGHHGYLNIPETDEWLIVYHRRIIGDTEPGHRVLCIDKLNFDGDEIIEVEMT